MTDTNKTQLINDWGFERQTFGSKYCRDIYKPQGYLEFWSPANPDVIQFYRHGEWSHDYVIDWSLFN